jgi:4-diphosphocytidyl-2-C-methyl-D-erythritol kinase
MTGPRHARVLSPAKINLGLEILGRREDGYHEIRSVLAMVDLVDEISISTADDLCSTRLDGVPGVAVENNLILRAVSRFAAFTGVSSAYDIHVHKRIPAAAGLGGASSNAAATILALNAMHGSPIGEPDLHALASELGSDVPFFLGSPVAAVSGRGTDLAPLPALHGVVLIAVPRIDLPGKTGTLYRLLTAQDFTDGATVETIARQVSRGERIQPDLLDNAFERPLREIAPGASTLVGHMQRAGCTRVALSGAGPALYALFDNELTAQRAKSMLDDIGNQDVIIAVAPFRSEPMRVELD